MQEKARALGVDPAEYLLRMIDEAPSGESLGERLKRKGILGGVAGKPRAAGRPWSEVEGFE